MFLQKIKNCIGRALGYCDCHLCGNTIWREDTGEYGGLKGWIICGKCKRREDVLIYNLRSRFYIDPKLGKVLGTTVFCPSCNGSMYRYIFAEGRSLPVGAYCLNCNKTVGL